MELNKRFTLITEKGTISTEGIQAVLRYLRAQDLHGDGWGLTTPAPRYLWELPESFEWVWLTAQGAFPKRVARYYYQAQRVKLPDSVKAEVGNLARRYSESEVSYTFELVNRVDWRAGDFGDSGSCYWGSNSEARNILHDNAALAIRFYNGEQGIGRAWIATIEDSMYIVFNGYGFPNPTFTIARVFAAWRGLTFKGIGLTSNGTADGTLWIDGGKGYAVGAPDQMADFAGHYDLEWDDPYAYRCERCGDVLSEVNAYSDPDGYTYCADCYYELFADCGHCGETVANDYATYVDGEMICEYCLSRHYQQCEDCGEWFRDLPEYGRMVDGKPYCMGCVVLPDKK